MLARPTGPSNGAIPRMYRLTCLILLALALPAQAEVLRFYGYAYDLKTDRHLYTEVHEQRTTEGRWTGGSIRYYLPDGRKLGVKPLDFTRDPFVPVFRMDLLLEGYSEGISDAGDPLVLERRMGRNAKLERKSLKREGPICADSGFHAFLIAHFDRLMKGEKIGFRLAVPGSLDAFRFRARRIADTSFENQPAVRFYIEPDSLLRFMVDPLELIYDAKTQRLLEYRGVSNIRNPADGEQYLTRISYYSKPPKDVGKLPPLEPES